MSNTVKKPLLSAGNMTRIAILAAAASILFLLEIPVVAFYKLDLSNIPVLLGAFSMGTVPGLIILGLKSAIARKNALIGMLVGTICTAIVGVLVNKFIMLPFYMGAFHMDMEGILSYAKVSGVDSEWKLLLLITGPFNLLKGAVLSAVTFLIYKPLSPILHSRVR